MLYQIIIKILKSTNMNKENKLLKVKNIMKIIKKMLWNKSANYLKEFKKYTRIA